MSKPANGCPAFPIVCKDVSMHQVCESGMTLQDYFAAKAMHAIMQRLPADTKLSPGEAYEKLALSAYAIAEAMLAEREK